MSKKPIQREIPILYHPDAQAELSASLDVATVADVVVIIDKLKGKTHQELVSLLDTRSERKVCQWECSHSGGTLRVVFSWGKGCLWFIGAFVKVNDPHGERLMKRILPRADEVKRVGLDRGGPSGTRKI